MNPGACCLFIATVCCSFGGYPWKARADQFEGPYALSNWSVTNQGSVHPEMAVTLAPSDLRYSYDVNLGGGGVPFRTSTIQHANDAALTISFDYTYTGFHAFFQAFARLEAFANTGMVQTVVTIVNQSVSGNFSFSGTASITLTPGQTWGVRVGGSNFDANSRLMGTLTISRLRYEGHNTLPGFTGPYALNTWSLTSMAAAVDSLTTTTAGIDARYALNRSPFGVGPQNMDLIWIADRDQILTFDWHYSGNHSVIDARLGLQVHVGPTVMDLVPFQFFSGPFTFSGTVMFPIMQGQTLRWRALGRTGDEQSFIDGILILRNLRAQGFGCRGDANHDGFVTFSDITTVLEQFNAVCP